MTDGHKLLHNAAIRDQTHSGDGSTFRLTKVAFYEDAVMVAGNYAPGDQTKKHESIMHEPVELLFDDMAVPVDVKVGDASWASASADGYVSLSSLGTVWPKERVEVRIAGAVVSAHLS